MFTQQARRSGNSFVVTIPKEEAERLGLVDGQPVFVHITPAETRPILPPAVQEAFDRLWPEMEPAMRYLKDR